MKAQAKIEFLITTFIFLVFILISSNFFSDNIERIVYDIKMERIKAQAENIVEILAYEKGIPENWELASPEEIKRIGLAFQPYILFPDKIQALNNNCELFRNIFNTPSYRIVIMDEDGNVLLNCGIKSNIGAHFERPVRILEGSKIKKGKLILDVWW